MKKYRLLIGAVGPGGSRSQNEKDWTLSVDFIAYREPGAPLTECEGNMRLANCNYERLKELQEAIKPYSVINAISSLEKKHGRYYHIVTELLETSVPNLPDETAIFERYQLPVTFIDAQFGEFVFNRVVGWFDGIVEFQGKKISVSVYGKEDIPTLAFIFKDFEQFLQQAKHYAAKEMLELGNQWQYDAWQDDKDDGNTEAEFTPITEEDFVKRISLHEIIIEDSEEPGEYTLWFKDGDIFWGHSITVSGNINTGFTDAQMHG